MKTLHTSILAVLIKFCVLGAAFAQVNSGSNGSDGALSPTTDLVIDMADHPDGIYHYTSVNIPAGVTVSFIPNAANKPVVWLVQGDCVIGGAVDLSSQKGWSWGSLPEQTGGPGGYPGGNGGTAASFGQGPGGGNSGSQDGKIAGGNGSFATDGTVGIWGADQQPFQAPSGAQYGNPYLSPLIGGSGGGGNGWSHGGGGGGGILIVASGTIQINGSITANGSNGGMASAAYVNYPTGSGGAGSGGAIRLVGSHMRGSGSIAANGGSVYSGNGWGGLMSVSSAGNGRVRFDSFDNGFNGSISGNFTQGFQPIIFPAPGESIQLAIQSVGGATVSSSPSGVLANPDVIIPAQQANPVSVVVRCINIPLNTEISVMVRPAHGANVQAVALNATGTLASSTATVTLNLPRGGGTLYARCVTGIAGLVADASPAGLKTKSLAETGWTADGERFAQVEITSALGGAQQIAYITESGKRHLLR